MSGHGALVSDHIPKAGGAESVRLAALNASYAAGTLVVDYHQQYSAVLEDAIIGRITSTASQIMTYVGEVNLNTVKELAGHSLSSLITEISPGSYYRVRGDVSAPISCSFNTRTYNLSSGDSIIVNKLGHLDVFDSHTNVVTASSSIKVDQSNPDSYVVSVSTDYTAEVKGKYDAAVNTEKTRAEGAEGILTTAVTTEKTRALAAEGILTTAVSSEESRAEGAEGALKTAVTTEATTARAAEGVLTTAVSDEKTRALAAEGTLTTSVTNMNANLGPILQQIVLRFQNIEAFVVNTEKYIKSANYVAGSIPTATQYIGAATATPVVVGTAAYPEVPNYDFLSAYVSTSNPFNANAPGPTPVETPPVETPPVEPPVEGTVTSNDDVAGTTTAIVTTHSHINSLLTGWTITTTTTKTDTETLTGKLTLVYDKNGKETSREETTYDTDGNVTT